MSSKEKNESETFAEMMQNSTLLLTALLRADESDNIYMKALAFAYRQEKYRKEPGKTVTVEIPEPDEHGYCNLFCPLIDLLWKECNGHLDFYDWKKGELIPGPNCPQFGVKGKAKGKSFFEEMTEKSNG